MIFQPFSHPSLSMDADNQQSPKELYKNATFYIEQCELGWGMFAQRHIPKGEALFVFGGSLIDFAETKKRGLWECMPIQIGHNRYIDTLPPGIFVNHSCDPNAGIVNDRDLIALRDIQRDEEIRFDYSTTMEEKSFTMKCLCGSLNCRQTVADFSTLPEELQDKYFDRKIVMSFIVNKLISKRASRSPAQ